MIHQFIAKQLLHSNNFSFEEFSIRINFFSAVFRPINCFQTTFPPIIFQQLINSCTICAELDY